MEIGKQHQQQLIERGYTIVPGFLSKEELAAARRGVATYFPSADELAATPLRYGQIAEDPEHLQIEFPFASDELNALALNERLIRFTQQVLGTEHACLTQSALWAKYAGTGDFEQSLHLDYEGNTLVVPRDDGSYRQINMIVYYSDVAPELGPTYVVSQQQTKDLPMWPTHRPRKKNTDLYALEKPVLAQAGDLLIFSMRTWHRASAITADQGARFSHHYIWRAIEHGFQGFHLWSSRGEQAELKRAIEKLTPTQRSALGFPPPGDPYWTEETLSAVAMRYPKMDLAPYRMR